MFLFLLFPSSPTAQQGANTLITDLCSCTSFFSPSLSVSSSHQLSFFRDELLLFFYLYQRWWDTTHVNEHKLTCSLINSLNLPCRCFISSPGVTPPRPDDESLGHRARRSRLTKKKKKKKISLNNEHREALFETSVLQSRCENEDSALQIG